jgi:hypothetical protein
MNRRNQPRPHVGRISVADVLRAIGCLLMVFHCLFGRAEATSYDSLHLYKSVELSDVIVRGTVTNAERAVIRVDERLKGQTESSIRLVDYVDLFNAPEHRRALVNGDTELLFLKQLTHAYAPLQTQYGRWPVRDGRVELPPHLRRLGLADYRQTITTLVHLQAAAAQGGGGSVKAYIAALQSSDPHVTYWGAHTAPQRISEPSSELTDAYLRLWSRGDPDWQGAVANAVIEWKLRRAGAMLSAALRQGGDAERASAARGLGGTGDRAFLGQLRAAAASDPSKHVRSAAVDGLAQLLGSEAIPDLIHGSQDRDRFVRMSVAGHALNLAQTDRSPKVRAGVRRVLVMLSNDPDREVQRSARSLLKRLETLR